eukprot:4453735-Pleurochrysis_carterae.AAC.2
MRVSARACTCACVRTFVCQRVGVRVRTGERVMSGRAPRSARVWWQSMRAPGLEHVIRKGHVRAAMSVGMSEQL